MKVYCACYAKMEEICIEDYVKHNKKIGVDKIIIGDNNDSNYNPSIYSLLKSYIDDGFVEILNYNDNINGFKDFFTEVYQNYRSEFDWLLLLDADEYVNICNFKNIKEFFEQDKFKDVDCINVTIADHTDNNHIYSISKFNREEYPKIKKYYIRNDNKIMYIKSFYRSRSYINYITNHHTPDYNIVNSDFIRINNLNKGIYPHDINVKKYLDCVDVLGNIIPQPNYYPAINANDEYLNTLYIDHYPFKSTEDFIKNKIKKGRGMVKGYNNNTKIGLRATYGLYQYINDMTDEKISLFNKYHDDIEKWNNEYINKAKQYLQDKQKNN